MTDTSGHDDEQEDDYDLRERVRAAAERVEQAGLKVGLYMEHAQPAITHDGQLLVQVQFRVGDLAFTSRVLDPATEDTNRVVREMEVDQRLDEFNRIARQAKEGTGILAELEGDDDDAV